MVDWSKVMTNAVSAVVAIVFIGASVIEGLSDKC